MLIITYYFECNFYLNISPSKGEGGGGVGVMQGPTLHTDQKTLQSN